MVARRQLDRLHQPHARRALRGRGRSWQSPRKIERFFSRLNGEDWIFDRPQHVYVVPADGTGAPRNLTPGPFQHGGVSWLARLVRRSSPPPQRHDDVGPRPRRRPVPRAARRRDRRSAALTKQTGAYSTPSVSPDGAPSRSSAPTTRRRPAELPASASIPVDGGDHRWSARDLDRTFVTTAGTLRPDVARRRRRCSPRPRTAARPTCTELHVDGARPGGADDGPLARQGLRRRGGTIARDRSTSTSPPSCSCSTPATCAG